MSSLNSLKKQNCAQLAGIRATIFVCCNCRVQNYSR